MARTTPLPALQQRDFRLLWIGQLFSTIGSQMQLIVVNWHVYLLLRGQVDRILLLGWHFSLNAQAVGLGMLGAVRILPIFLFAFLGVQSLIIEIGGTSFSGHIKRASTRLFCIPN